MTEIGESAFFGCTSLESFYGKFASDDNRCLIVNGELIFFAPANLTTYSIPNYVTEIGESAFYGCSSLTSVTIGDSVTSIGSSAFSSCRSLTRATIGNGVTSIGWCAFKGCSSLTSVTIGYGVTSIEGYAFYDCTSLTSVYCKRRSPPTGGVCMFRYSNDGYEQTIYCDIYVPHNCVSEYQSARYWREYASNIVGYNF